LKAEIIHGLFLILSNALIYLANAYFYMIPTLLNGPEYDLVNFPCEFKKNTYSVVVGWNGL
jgi:hypothetical protein